MKIKNTEIILKEGKSALDTWYIFKKGNKTINVSDPALSYSPVIYDYDNNGNLYNERANPISLEQYKNEVFLRVLEELENEET